jgi:hypothetical protein
MPTTTATDLEDTLFPEFPLIPEYSVHDGVETWALLKDDDRSTNMWSHYHAERVTTMLRELRARAAAFQWQVTDVSARGNAALTAQAESNLAAVRAELAAWEAKRDLLETARRADSYAPTSWNWE